MRRKPDPKAAPADGQAEDGKPSLPKQALLAHFKALRNTILISAISVGVAFVVIFTGFSTQLMDILKMPINARGVELIYISLPEPIVMQMKVSFIAAFIAAFPVIIWQVWSFLRPALYPHEGRLFWLFLFTTLILFLTGAFFAYLIVFQMAINFFIGSGEGVATAFISVEKYINLLTGFVLPFGLMFELPVVMGLLTKAGILTAAACSRFRKFVVFAIFIVAAILTPPDVVSQVLLALPLLVLFEIGIIVSRIVGRRQAKREAALYS